MVWASWMVEQWVGRVCIYVKVYKLLYQSDRIGSGGGHLASWTRRGALSPEQTLTPTAAHAAEPYGRRVCTKPNPKPPAFWWWCHWYRCYKWCGCFPQSVVGY